jgi:hypothetical protein
VSCFFDVHYRHVQGVSIVIEEPFVVVLYSLSRTVIVETVIWREDHRCGAHYINYWGVPHGWTLKVEKIGFYNRCRGVIVVTIRWSQVKNLSLAWGVIRMVQISTSTWLIIADRRTWESARFLGLDNYRLECTLILVQWRANWVMKMSTRTITC